jgi:rhodanese-related sulfurtransferase
MRLRSLIQEQAMAVAVLNRPQPQAPLFNEFDREHPALRDAQAAAAPGSVAVLSPHDAWELVLDGQAVLLDVRTAEERKFVGFVPRGLHIAWQTGTAMQSNPRFVRELESKVSKDALVVVLCRSGQRSRAAAAAAIKAGFRNVYSIAGGFEGDLDEQGQRGHLNGWRHLDLPWQQD